MTVANFPDPVYLETLKWEGGAAFTDDPRDPGGPTKYGVTIATLSHELGHQASISDVRNMTYLTASGIAKKKFWNCVGGDGLPSGVDMIAFDIAYNSGAGYALRWLAETAEMNPVSRIEALHAYRMGFWHKLRIWIYYGKGWTNRENDVLTHSLALARAHSAILS